MLIGYARVSKSDKSQLLDLQRNALIAEGIQIERIYEDLASGRKDDRPGLRNCLHALKSGDVLVVWKLDRLGQDLKHLVTLVEDLSKKNIGLKVISGQAARIDTTTANGKLIFSIFAALAEFERELIAERTSTGLAAARARGRLGGRPRKMDAATLKMAIAVMTDRSSVASDVAKHLGITTTTLYKYINGDGTPKETATKILRALTSENNTI